MALDGPALSLIPDGSKVLRPDQPKGGRIAPSIWPNYSDRVAELLRNPGRVAPKNAFCMKTRNQNLFLCRRSPPLDRYPRYSTSLVKAPRDYVGTLSVPGR